MEDLYRDNIIDHYQNPRNYGTLEHPDISYEDSNPVCGDEIRMDLKIQNGRVIDARFQGHGCSISQASASMLTEEIIGKTLEEVRQIDKQYLLDMLGIPLGPVRLKCALSTARKSPTSRITAGLRRICRQRLKRPRRYFGMLA